MNLPSIDLPQIPIPFEIPHMMHPCVVHFAVALPFVVLFLEIINLFVKKRTVGIVAFVFSLIASATIIASYMTGNVDASLTSVESLVQAHKALGAYLVIISLAVVLFKLFSVMIRTGIVKAIYLMILIIFVGVMTKEGISGKELVYKDGVNVQAVNTLQQQLKETSIKLSTLKKEIETLKAHSVSSTTTVKTSTKEEEKQIQTVDNSVETVKQTIEENSTQEPKAQLQDSIRDVDVEDEVTDVNATNDINNTKI